MRVLVTACEGQLGRALMASPPSGMEVVGIPRHLLDITDLARLRECAEAVGPHLIINAAAYTAVDAAERDEAAAFAVNRDGVANLASVASDLGARLVHISTDFVFDGSASSPYAVDAPTGPLNVYGLSKLAGELAAGHEALIIRTAWVYAAQGRNFVTTMLRLMRERGEVRVVADQIGAPTWATSLAETIWALIAQERQGIWHVTDSGVASWYDFAVAIAEEALALGLLDHAPTVIPIRTVDYPTPAQRPAYSVLDTTATAQALGQPATHWRSNLRRMLAEVAEHG